MLNVFLYSLAGKKRRDDLDEVLLEMLSKPYFSKFDIVSLKYTYDVGQKGVYPDKSYYQSYYEEASGIKSLSELKLYVDKLYDFYSRESIVASALTIINESNSREELVEKLGSVIEGESSSEKDDIDGSCSVKSYSDMVARPPDAGYESGIKDIDDLTNGWQPGCIATVAAFTSEGKSTFWVSSIYKNVKKGKKGVLMSLEVHPSIVWMQLLSRFLYEEKGVEVKAQDLIQRTLTKEMKEIVDGYEIEFKDMFSGLLICDESYISTTIAKSPKLLKGFYKKCERTLGRIDFTVWDHVNQLDLMFADLGNTFIRTIQSAGKTYVNTSSLPIFTGFACQVNREGWKRACKRQGLYDLTAISDLNEVERSSTYVIFMFTSNDMKMNQETKITMAKNRLGGLLVEPVTTTFNPEVMVVGDLIEMIQYDQPVGNIDASGFGDSDFE